jgi:hypothetical protein
MTYTTHQWQKRIRAEFDMPAKDVIRAFAADKYSKRLTRKEREG